MYMFRCLFSNENIICTVWLHNVVIVSHWFDLHDLLDVNTVDNFIILYLLSPDELEKLVTSSEWR